MNAHIELLHLNKGDYSDFSAGWYLTNGTIIV